MTPNGIWTFVKNATSSTPSVSGKGTSALRTARLPPTATLADVAGWVNRLLVSLEDIARRVRQLPFGGPGTVLLAIQFTSGIPLTVAHYLGDSAGTSGQNVMVFTSSPRSLSAGQPWATWTANATTVTFTPAGTFVADVLLMTSPL